MSKLTKFLSLWGYIMRCLGNFDNERICDLCKQVNASKYNECKMLTQQKIDAAKRIQDKENRLNTEYYNFVKKCPYYKEVEVWEERHHEFDYMACYKFGCGKTAPYCSDKFNLERCTQYINEYNLKRRKSK